MIRSHVLGLRESVMGSMMHHTYTFYDEPGTDDMRIVELYLDPRTSGACAFNDPKLYREHILMMNEKIKLPIPVFVDGKQYNSRHHARSLYKMLLGMGYTPYTS